MSIERVLEADALGDPLQAVRQLVELCSDPDEEVRAQALQTLVLDRQQTDRGIHELCWRMLSRDPSEEVRGVAATCLGAMSFGKRDASTFDRLATMLETEASDYVRGLLYSALFKAAGRPPAEWPLLQSASGLLRREEVRRDEVERLRRLVVGA